MIYTRHKNFIPALTLDAIYNELMSGTRWTYRNNFWRYYLVENLTPYQENDQTTWYGNQKEKLYASLKDHWLDLFDQVFDLAGPDFVLQRYALTGQTQGQEQEMHLDTSLNQTGDFRSYLLYLNTHWNQSWGGLTEVQLDSSVVYGEIPEPGKLVVFNSQSLHRGQSPNRPNILRLSLVLHGKHCS